MDSDDEPPPIESLSDQLAALNQRRKETQPVASTPAVAAKVQPAKKDGVKKGFFDAPAAKKSKEPELIEVKAKPRSTAPGAAIPDFLKLKPDEQEAKIKAKMQVALKPDQTMLADVQNNSKLMSGFDDPEVMAAVAEVSKDSRAMAKYQNNPKVVAFYSEMAALMGKKFDRLADEQERQQAAQGAGQGAPAQPQPPPPAKAAPTPVPAPKPQPKPKQAAAAPGIPGGFLLSKAARTKSPPKSTPAQLRIIEGGAAASAGGGASCAGAAEERSEDEPLLRARTTTTTTTTLGSSGAQRKSGADAGSGQASAASCSAGDDRSDGALATVQRGEAGVSASCSSAVPAGAGGSRSSSGDDQQKQRQQTAGNTIVDSSSGGQNRGRNVGGEDAGGRGSQQAGGGEAIVEEEGESLLDSLD